MAEPVEHPAKGWAGTYGRKSNLPRAFQSHSPENQDRITKHAALIHGLRIKPGYEFFDVKSASKDVRRQGFEGAVAALMNREIEALIVPKLDRLSRRGMGQIGLLLDDLEQVGGRIIFVGDGLDSSKPNARPIIAFLSEQARQESLGMAWRMEQFHEGARVSGKWVWPRPYGYLVEDHRLKPHPVEAPIVRWIIDEFLNGASYRSIANSLNERGLPCPRVARAAEAEREGRPAHKPREHVAWGYTTVRVILTNPALCGWHAHKGRVVIDADSEPISYGEGLVEPAEYVRIQSEVERRTTVVRHAHNTERIGGKTGGGRPAKYLLTGFGKCASCGYGMLAGRWGRARDRSAYKCNGRVHGYGCTAPGWATVGQADAEAVRQLTFRLAAMEPDDPILGAIAARWLRLRMPEQEGDRSILDGKLSDIRARIANLDEARYGRGEFETAEDIARWEQLRRNLLEQRSAVQAALDELGPPPALDLGDLLDTFRSRPAWDALPLAQKRMLLSVAVAKVWIRHPQKGQVPIEDRIQVLLVGEEDKGPPDAGISASGFPTGP